MNDETKKDDYYREQWAKIQVEQHNAANKLAGLFLLFIILFMHVENNDIQ